MPIAVEDDDVIPTVANPPPRLPHPQSTLATPSAVTSSSAVAVAVETPTFVAEPDDVYYVLRSKPATITCRAVSAVQINFKCVGQWVSPSQHVVTDGIETYGSTRRRYVQVYTTVNLTTGVSCRNNARSNGIVIVSFCFFLDAVVECGGQITCEEAINRCIID